MSRLIFEFNVRKAATNLKKHGVSFAEAMTVFDDLLAETFPDDLHSEDEDRCITIGLSSRQRLLFVSHRDVGDRVRLIGERRANATERNAMKTSKAAAEHDDLSPRPLDFSKAVRGKYYKRMQEGTNVILLAPDLLDTFPDSDSVNEALRSLKKIADRSSATPRAKRPLPLAS